MQQLFLDIKLETRMVESSAYEFVSIIEDMKANTSLCNGLLNNKKIRVKDCNKYDEL